MIETGELKIKGKVAWGPNHQQDPRALAPAHAIERAGRGLQRHGVGGGGGPLATNPDSGPWKPTADPADPTRHAGPETTGCRRAPPTSSSLLSAVPPGSRAPSCRCWVLIRQKTPRGPPLLPQGPLHQLPEPSPSWAWGRLPQREPRAASYAQDACGHGAGGGGQLVPSVLGSSPGPHPQGPGLPAPPWPWTGAQPPCRPGCPALGTVSGCKARAVSQGSSRLCR